MKDLVLQMSQWKERVPWQVAAYGIILFSFFLRVFHLNDVGVHVDEYLTINFVTRNDLIFILTHSNELNNHPLNSLLTYLASIGSGALQGGVLTKAAPYKASEVLFPLRWHSVAIGVLSVAALTRVARLLFGVRHVLVAGWLMGISAFHVTLSQRTRGYVGLLGFTIFAFYFAYQAVQTRKRRYWLGFIVFSILCVYSHLYGVIAVGIVSLTMLSLAIQPGKAVPTWPTGIVSKQSLRATSLSIFLPLVVSLIAVYLISLALYLPMLSDVSSIVGQYNRFRAMDVRQAERFVALAKIHYDFISVVRSFALVKAPSTLHLGEPTFQYSPFNELAALAQNNVGFQLSQISFLLGLILSWFKYRKQVLILIMWFVLPFIMQPVVGTILPGSYFRSRFLMFVYPPYILLMARAWPELADWLRSNVNNQVRLKRLVSSVSWLGVGALTVLNLSWLGGFYSAAANESWSTVAHHVSRNLRQNDIVTCVEPLRTACYWDLAIRTKREVLLFDDPTLEKILDRRASMERPHPVEWPGRIWVVMPYLSAGQLATLAESVKPTRYWTAGNPKHGQVGWVLVDSQTALGDNLADSLQLAANLTPDAEKKYEHYLHLAQLYLARKELTKAEETLALASEVVPDNLEAKQKLQTFTERLWYAQQLTEPLTGLPLNAVRVDRNYGEIARLTAYEVSSQTVSPGDILEVKLYWQPMSRIERDLVTYVHLTDRGANLVGQADGIPGAGQSPTPSWKPGQMIVDSYTIKIDDSLPAPLMLSIETGLFDPKTHQFIQAIDDTGQLISSTIAETKVVPRVWPSVSPTHRAVNADFEGLISLVGYDLATEPPGVVFYWRSQALMSEDYVVFVHLLDGKGQIVAQMDGEPLGGQYPTSRWSPGDLITDRRTLPVLTPGDYRLLVGWYRLADGSRLSLAGSSQRRDSGRRDSIELVTINVPQLYGDPDTQ